jgi:hypothetical protein
VAKVARAGGDFGSLLQHAGKTKTKDGRDSLAALADREIREGTIGQSAPTDVALFGGEWLRWRETRYSRNTKH